MRTRLESKPGAPTSCRLWLSRFEINLCHLKTYSSVRLLRLLTALNTEVSATISISLICWVDVHVASYTLKRKRVAVIDIMVSWSCKKKMQICKLYWLLYTAGKGQLFYVDRRGDGKPLTACLILKITLGMFVLRISIFNTRVKKCLLPQDTYKNKHALNQNVFWYMSPRKTHITATPKIPDLYRSGSI